MKPLSPSERVRVRRLPDRGKYDRATIDSILDEGLVCHAGFVTDGQPYVIPMVYGRVGDSLYLHASAASRLTRVLAAGAPVCVTVTLLDGLVLARSAFHHSVNYRSVVVLGTAAEVIDPAERDAALEAIVGHMLAGRWGEVRPPNTQELKATAVLKLPLGEASAKVRSGPPIDDAEDLALGCWAGVVPLRLAAGTPVPDPKLAAGIKPGPAISAYERPTKR